MNHPMRRQPTFSFKIFAELSIFWLLSEVLHLFNRFVAEEKTSSDDQPQILFSSKRRTRQKWEKTQKNLELEFGSTDSTEKFRKVSLHPDVSRVPTETLQCQCFLGIQFLFRVFFSAKVHARDFKSDVCVLRFPMTLT